MKKIISIPGFRCALVIAATLGLSTIAIAQAPHRTPTETVREFYKMLREKKFREAFEMSIYKPAVEGLSQKEFDDFRPDFEKMAHAVTEKMPANLDFTGEQISGDTATVFLRILDAEGKEKVVPATLIKIDDKWIVGDHRDLEQVKKIGRQFFFEARINAHHDDVKEMLTRISLAQVVYAQGHNGLFGNLADLITGGLVPKDIEGTESTGYRFQVMKSADGKSWYATAEPTQYGKSGRLSFYLDAAGERNGDNGGKPLVVKN